MPENLTWRRAIADDEPLLLALFTAAKSADFAPLGLSLQQLEPLLDMQYRARAHSYTQNHPSATDIILCLEDGTAVGRHLIERLPDCYRSIDLAVLPEFQGSGVGTWALSQIQQIAALESVPVRLRVMRDNPALRLYERLGFLTVSADELSFQMEWRPEQMTCPGGAALPRPESEVVCEDGSALPRMQVVETIIGFLREIGLTVELGPVASTAFLPGLQLFGNGLRVDLDTLLYPGDLLHEAGHLAVMTPRSRAQELPDSADPAEEMGALAWSYAAAMHLGLPPEVVFHQQGYRGQASTLVRDFTAGRVVGLPFLWWIGLTTQPQPDSPSIFPKMLRWLRAADALVVDTVPSPESSGQRDESA